MYSKYSGLPLLFFTRHGILSDSDCVLFYLFLYAYGISYFSIYIEEIVIVIEITFQIYCKVALLSFFPFCLCWTENWSYSFIQMKCALLGERMI